MSNNPFKKIVVESVGRIDKIEQSITMLEHFLTQAAEALNESIQGNYQLTLKTKYSPGTLPPLDVFSYSISNENKKSKTIFLANEFQSKIVANIIFDESGEDMSLTINKLKSTYPTSEDGFISCIGSMLSTTNITDWAVKLRRDKTL